MKVLEEDMENQESKGGGNGLTISDPLGNINIDFQFDGR